MTVNKKQIFICIALPLFLCLAQILGNTMLILACLVSYLAVLAWGCWNHQALLILMFFLPWSPLMRLSPTSYSFYTFGMVLSCCISMVRNNLKLKKYAVITGILLLVTTLLSKLLSGSTLQFDYIAFIMMIVLFPVVKEEKDKREYDFYQIVLYFSLGVVIASLCALYFSGYYNIRRFIRVDEYQTIIRRSGFYGDANFYVAQILAALGGALSLTLQEKKRSKVVILVVVVLFLLYCGFLSGSKSFALVSALILLLWIIATLRLRGRLGLKIVLLSCFFCAVVFIASSTMFGGLIEVIAERFSRADDFDSFTTGRLGLWDSYLDDIFSDFKVFFLGQGFTNIKVNGKASHSTVIQILYQFGLLGAPVLAYWIGNFFRIDTRTENTTKKFGLNQLMIIVGAFVPWLALDILFFDEFFLFQWYVLAAMTEFEERDPMQKSFRRLRLRLKKKR